jgi:hypothetical protein
MCDKYNVRLIDFVVSVAWRWAIDHGQHDNFFHVSVAYDDSILPLAIALRAFGLDAEQPIVQATLRQIEQERGPCVCTRGDDGVRIPMIYGKDLVTHLCPLSSHGDARAAVRYHKAGHLIGDIPKGVQRLRAHTDALAQWAQDHGAAIDIEAMQDGTPWFLFTVTSLPLILKAFNIPTKRHADFATPPEWYCSRPHLCRIARVSTVPVAKRFTAWFQHAFLPAIHTEGWYDPARWDALPIRREVRAMEFATRWQAEAGRPYLEVDTEIIDAFEDVALFNDRCDPTDNSDEDDRIRQYYVI